MLRKSSKAKALPAEWGDAATLDAQEEAIKQAAMADRILLTKTDYLRAADVPRAVAAAEAIARKPKGHDFIIDRRHSGPAVPRHMSVTGG